MVWDFAPSCGGQFCKFRFWLVSGAKAAAAQVVSAAAPTGVWLHHPAAPLGMWVCVSALLRVLWMKLESQPVAEVVKTR